MTSRSAKKRVTRRAAIATVAFVSIAAPAAAGVLIQNFIKGTVTAVAPCFVKVAGVDSTTYGTPAALAGTGPYVKFDATPTLSAGGVSLINETVAIRGFSGDRTKYTDVVRYQNNCAVTMTVRLTAEADPAAGAVTSGPWDSSVRVFVSTAAATVPVASTNLETDAVNWNQQFFIDATGAIVTTGSTAIAVTAGSQLQGAFTVDVPSTAVAASTRTFRYTATATA